MTDQVFARTMLVFMLGGLVTIGLLTWALGEDKVDVDLDQGPDPCTPRAATVPGPGWGFAACRPDQVGEVVFSPSGQAVLNCVCGD